MEQKSYVWTKGCLGFRSFGHLDAWLTLKPQRLNKAAPFSTGTNAINLKSSPDAQCDVGTDVLEFSITAIIHNSPTRISERSVMLTYWLTCLTEDCMPRFGLELDVELDNHMISNWARGGSRLEGNLLV